MLSRKGTRITETQQDYRTFPDLPVLSSHDYLIRLYSDRHCRPTYPKLYFLDPKAKASLEHAVSLERLYFAEVGYKVELDSDSIMPPELAQDSFAKGSAKAAESGF